MYTLKKIVSKLGLLWDILTIYFESYRHVVWNKHMLRFYINCFRSFDINISFIIKMVKPVPWFYVFYFVDLKGQSMNGSEIIHCYRTVWPWPWVKPLYIQQTPVCLALSNSTPTRPVHARCNKHDSIARPCLCHVYDPWHGGSSDLNGWDLIKCWNICIQDCVP